MTTDLAHWARPGFFLIASDRPARICGHPAKPGSVFCRECRKRPEVQAYMKERAARSRKPVLPWAEWLERWKEENEKQ